MGLPSPQQASTWGGKLVVDPDGAAIGTVTQIYSDDATGLPEWATIRLGEATVFLPLLDAEEADGRVRVQVKRDDVAKAPMVGPGRRISEQEEERLYRYYGIDYTRERSPSLLPRGIGPVPTWRQRLARRARDTQLGALALAAALTATSVVVAFLGLRGRSRTRPQAVVAEGAAAITSTEAARAARRAASRAARDALRQTSDAADSAAKVLDQAGDSRRRRGRSSGPGRSARRG
jgi:PRC-barrel domain protein